MFNGEHVNLNGSQRRTEKPVAAPTKGVQGNDSTRSEQPLTGLLEETMHVSEQDDELSSIASHTGDDLLREIMDKALSDPSEEEERIVYSPPKYVLISCSEHRCTVSYSTPMQIVAS